MHTNVVGESRKQAEQGDLSARHARHMVDEDDRELPFAGTVASHLGAWALTFTVTGV